MIRKLLIILLFISGSASMAHGQTYILGPVQFATAACSDADATAYCTAAGITDATFKSALCTYVTSMKAHGNWAAIQGRYILTSGSYAKCKLNLKDPTDADGSFRYTESGTITYSTGLGAGAHGDGGSYLDTHYDVSANSASINSFHLMFYSMSNISEASTDMGIVAGVSADIELYLNTFYSAMNNATYFSAGLSTTKGYFLSNRTNSTNTEIRQNNTSMATSSAAASARPSGNVKIFTSNGSLFSNKVKAIASFGAALPDPTADYNDTVTFLTAIGAL